MIAQSVTKTIESLSIWLTTLILSALNKYFLLHLRLQGLSKTNKQIITILLVSSELVLLGAWFSFDSSLAWRSEVELNLRHWCDKNLNKSSAKDIGKQYLRFIIHLIGDLRRLNWLDFTFLRLLSLSLTILLPSIWWNITFPLSICLSITYNL